MTKSAPAPARIAVSPPAPVRGGWGSACLTLSLRLMLLGIGGGAMVIVGMAVAQLYPAQTQEPPLVELWLQRGKSMLNAGLLQAGIKLQPEAAAPVAAAPVAAAPPIASSGLSDAERQQLQAELTQLQAQLQALTHESSQPIATRVQPLQSRIQAIQAQLSDSFIADSASRSSAAPVAQDTLLVTLPSDALFDAEQTTLRSGSDAILSSILSDLQKFPNASILVSAYTDSQNAPDLARERTLEQAKAVRQYLAQQLGREIHWVAIGQGQNQPLVPDDSAENRQRNRRIEIAIQP